MKVLLDTNVLLDVVEKREPHFSDSYEVFLKNATDYHGSSVSCYSYAGDAKTQGKTRVFDKKTLRLCVTTFRVYFKS